MATPTPNTPATLTPAAPASDLAPALLAADEPLAVIHRATRWAFWALLLGFGGFVAWASFAPLDEGVPTTAMVSIDTKRKAVQHLNGGIITQVLVREGDMVQEGQVVARLDEAATRASYQSIRHRYLGLRATQSRLMAEQAGQSNIVFHPDVTQAATADLHVQQLVLTQQQLAASRRAALQADLQSIQETIQGQMAMLKAFDQMLPNRRQQLSLLNDELSHTTRLVKDGYVPRNRQLELERQVAEINSALAELQGNTTRAKRSIAELRERATNRQHEYRKEVETLLADIEREVQADADKLKAAQDELGRVDIKSPAAGQVVGLAFQTVGGVVSPGQKLMDIVPPDETLLLEAQVLPHLIDRVREGLPVDVRFSAFAHTPQLVVQGKVVSVSADNLTDPKTGNAYYLARVAVTPEGMATLGKREMRPGMPAEVVFKTGERSLLTYMLRPLVRRVAASMKEE